MFLKCFFIGYDCDIFVTAATRTYFGGLCRPLEAEQRSVVYSCDRKMAPQHR